VSSFGSLDQSWLLKFLEHRIADRRVLRLIQKWLAAGVIEDGEWSKTEAGTAQGASVSPLLSNVFLHYVFDLWADQWRRRHARGDVILVRYADDYVAGFEHCEDVLWCCSGLWFRLAPVVAVLTRLIIDPGSVGCPCSEMSSRDCWRRPGCHTAGLIRSMSAP
jgi:hypothetical protein